jgi:hypothetical protein
MKAWVEAARMAEMRYNYGIKSNKLDVEMVLGGGDKERDCFRIRAITPRVSEPNRHILFALPMTIVVIKGELMDSVRMVYMKHKKGRQMRRDCETGVGRKI